MKLGIIVASTRPTRVGHLIGQWVHERAVEHGKFDIELLDLAKFHLPLYDEPKHPSLQQYEHDHTMRWSASVAAADAFVIVTPEYNYGPPPSLINAFDYVYKEWNYKPAGFVSYGGVSGGLRAVQMEKQTLTTLSPLRVPLVTAETSCRTLSRNKIRSLGIAPSYAFVGEPQTNGVIERLFRTLKEQIVSVAITVIIELIRRNRGCPDSDRLQRVAVRQRGHG
jgi:NAD(P)H-dependent FMN reductase